jgi:hypothetical protein
LRGIEIIRGTFFDDLYDARGFSGKSTNAASASRLQDYNVFRDMGGDDGILGNGNTAVEYSVSMVGIHADLAAGVVDARLESDKALPEYLTLGRDLLFGVYRVRGSALADLLEGGGRGKFAASALTFESFEPGAGDDTIDGKGGWDGVAYWSAPAGIVYDGSASGAQVLNDGYGHQDTLRGVEQISGSRFDDVFLGSNTNVGMYGAVEAFEGNGGNDLMVGRGGLDEVAFYNAPAGVQVWLDTGATQATRNIAGESMTFRGRAEDGYGTVDLLSGIEGVEGSPFADTLNGGAGDEHFDGREGNDLIDGGAGTDWAEYNNAVAGVSVELNSGYAHDGFGGQDVLKNIENVLGSDYDDTFGGSSGNNVFMGLGGNDLMVGGAGTDVAVYRGARRDFEVNVNFDGSWTVRDLRDPSVFAAALGNMTIHEGTDTLRQMERIEFSSGEFLNFAGITPGFAVSVTGGAQPPQLRAAVSADYTVGQTLHLLYGRALSSSEQQSMSYRWQRGRDLDGDSLIEDAEWSDISDAKASTYTLSVTDRGARLRVEVSYDESVGQRQSVFSDASAPVAGSDGNPDILDLGTVQGMRLLLRHPVTLPNGKTYYVVDGDANGVIDHPDSGGHVLTDKLFNAGADTFDTQPSGAVAGVDDARTVVLPDYTVVMPTTSELTTLRNTLNLKTPEGWPGAGYNYASATRVSADVHQNVSLSSNDIFTNLYDSYGYNGIYAFQVLKNPPGAAPSIARATDKDALRSGEIATLSFNLSESSTDFGLDDIVATGGSVSNFSGSGTAYTASFTPSAGSTTTAVVSVASGRFTNLAGKSNADGADADNRVSIKVDTVSPVISIASTQSALKLGEVATVSFTLSESSTNFAASDVSVAGGTLSGFKGSGTAYTATLTPTSGVTGTAVVSVGSAAFTDEAGNANADGNDANNRVSISFDTRSSVPVPPTELYLGELQGRHLHLMSPYVTKSGKLYYVVDANNNGVLDVKDHKDLGDHISHVWLDDTFNGGADRVDTQASGAVAGVDDARTLLMRGLTLVNPTTDEIKSLRQEMNFSPPAGWKFKDGDWVGNVATSTRVSENVHHNVSLTTETVYTNLYDGYYNGVFVLEVLGVSDTVDIEQVVFEVWRDGDDYVHAERSVDGFRAERCELDGWRAVQLQRLGRELYGNVYADRWQHG